MNTRGICRLLYPFLVMNSVQLLNIKFTLIIKPANYQKNLPFSLWNGYAILIENKLTGGSIMANPEHKKSRPLYIADYIRAKSDADHWVSQKEIMQTSFATL